MKSFFYGGKPKGILVLALDFNENIYNEHLQERIEEISICY